MSDARACRYYGEVLRDDREFIAVDGEEFRVIIRVNQGGALVSLTLSHTEAAELGRHLRNCKP